MSALTFTLKSRPQFLLDVSLLTPDQLRGKNRNEIEKLQIHYGKSKVILTDLFSVKGEDSENIRILRSCSKLINIGREMSSGLITVRGDTGDYLGRSMSGGNIEVSGNSKNWTAAGMKGGTIHINGDTGDFLAAPVQGESHGMSNGTVIVRGNSGARCGERMRRGTLVIFGNCGDYCAAGMIAGTIIILGKTGSYLGFDMKRGTIVLAKKPRQMLSTFIGCGLLKVEFLRLLFKQLAMSDKQFNFFSGFGPEAIRFAGDSSCSGKGEILLLRNARLPK